ncbi:GSCFA domain-containing protein [Nonlabens ponticola]|uniref:GSCFA domain containing protein n=1 Tax=Nonlabens ponticola TaxID=2496866 RepID=A0A3S9N051_9FLAO|nr:GSCFA domain-containing protein [Nonlabens ponticola]AZQ44759.1 GSCFA domain containing protein [Nonlabens ponticola]
MKFTTSFEIEKHPLPIDHDSHVVLLGSCFTDHMYRKLRYYGFDAVSNPFGILFNPFSISHLVSKSIQDDFKLDDVESTFSYLAHSDIAGDDPDAVLTELQTAGKKLKESLNKATHVIITLGTSWIYELKESSQIVASCHQQPQKLFDKRLLKIDEINQSLNKLIDLIQGLTQASILFTVSPVRHTRDGMVENQRSKARLHEAIQQQVDAKRAYYFPSYELFMDDLRDYRFYDRDMIHPNEIGVDYVWLRFRESVINQNTATAIKALEKLRKLEQHRPKDAATHARQVDEFKVKVLNEFPNLTL